MQKAETAGIIPPELHHAKRRIEWVVLQHLLRLGGIKELHYLPNGKPEVIGPEYISISHGNALAGIALASVPVGLDCQHPDEKLVRIRQKFCGREELEFCAAAPDPLAMLTIVWSAKEAVFKYFGEEVHFARDIRLDPFAAEDRWLTAQYRGIHGEKEFSLLHEWVAGHHCVCTCEGVGAALYV